MRTRIGTLVCLTLVVAVALGGCGGKKKSSAPIDSGTTTVTVAPDGADTAATTVPGETTTTTLPGCKSKPEPTGPVTQAGTPDGVIFTNVRRDGDRCTDLVIFSFKSAAKAKIGYTVEYTTGPFTNASSGEPVQVNGTAFIRVKFQPAYPYDPATGQVSYDGPKIFTPAGGNYVTQVAQTDASEGVVTWIIGLNAKRPFAVKNGPESVEPEMAVEVT